MPEIEDVGDEQSTDGVEAKRAVLEARTAAEAAMESAAGARASRSTLSTCDR